MADTTTECSSSSYTSDSDDDRNPSSLGNKLICECVTPSGKTSLPLINDNKDGTYTVDINASEPGVHTIDVELDGGKIPGSPYLVRIVQAADPKKVHFYGKGLVSGLLEDFEGEFQIDSKGAGPGALKVRIIGPRGRFKVEMYRQNPEDRVVTVKFNPTCSGVYTINVLWENEHVECSPTKVFIADNYEELDKWNETN